ncbi:MAG: hypothetical protein PHI90_10860, partial [Clostridia bacterium]|nr:hypothetical protein [Clostridia bacterium]
MRKFIEGIKSDNRGLSETIAIVYSLLIFMVFAVLYVDLYGYFYTKNNLKQAVDETIILMKADNGYDDTVTRQYFDNIVLKLGLDTTKITL